MTLVKYSRFNKLRDSPAEVRNAWLVIAAFIAATTYRAVLNPPGGVFQHTTKSHTIGHAVMASTSQWSFGFFLFFNTLGFFTSIMIISIVMSNFPMRRELIGSLLAIVGAYTSVLLYHVFN